MKNKMLLVNFETIVVVVMNVDLFAVIYVDEILLLFPNEYSTTSSSSS